MSFYFYPIGTSYLNTNYLGLGYTLGSVFDSTSSYSPASIFYDGASAIWGGGVGTWPNFRLYGGVGGYISYLTRDRGGPSRSRRAKKEKDLPSGTGSASLNDRARAYLRNRHNIPSQTDVLKNSLGDNYKDKGVRDEAKKSDNALRVAAKEIIGAWLENEKFRSLFVEKWGRAGDAAEKVRALFDPNGDMSYAQILGKIAPELSPTRNDDEDGYWKRVADWFDDNLGSGVLASLGSEALSIAKGLGVSGVKPLDSAGREKYIAKLVDLGYTRDEAEAIAGLLKTEAAAEEALKKFAQQQNASSLESAKLELEENRARLAQAKKDKNKKDEKDFEANVKYIEKKNALLNEQRARQFLQNYMAFVRLYYGKEYVAGYEAGKLPSGVIDIVTAVNYAKSLI